MGAAEVCCGQFVPPTIQLGTANGDLEHLHDLFRMDATAGNTPAELALVQLAAPHRSHLIQHLILSVGKMLIQPLLEHRRDCVWQAQDHVPGTGRSCLGRGGDDLRDLVIVDRRDDRRHKHTGRDTGPGQLPYRPQPGRWERSARLKNTAQFRVERRHGNKHFHRVVIRQLLQQIEVSGDEGVLGHNTHRVTALGEHLKAAARELEPPLYRLVTVGVGTQRNRLRPITALGQFLPQQLRCVFLHHNARLKIQPGGKAKKLVRGTGEAVHTAVLAAAVRVNA